MAYIEVKVGTEVYRHTFDEADAVVGAALQRFARTMEPPVPEGATNKQKLEDAVEKIVVFVSRISARERLAELRDEQTAKLEDQAIQEGGLKPKSKVEAGAQL